MTLRLHQQEIVSTMKLEPKGQVIVPTGGGKTMCMIQDCIDRIKSSWAFQVRTIVVVAPRILLAEQLSSDFLEHVDNVDVMHVHSGETPHYSSTKPEKIRQWNEDNWKRSKLIFTTYHSLIRVMQSGVKVDTIYFDEAHNSVQKNFAPSVVFFAAYTERCYFFTATPKHSLTRKKLGMNDTHIFGDVIANVPAPELVNAGYILPPVVTTNRYPNHLDTTERDKEVILDTIKTQDSMEKVLVTAKSTRDISNLITQTNFQLICHSMGYSVMWITSKHGAIIDGEKVSRDKFFDTMNEWGNHPDKKFLMFHHSILSEGINVRGLTAAILMRNLDYITMAQTIGRVIRLHRDDMNNIDSGALTPGNVTGYRKPYGKLFVPVYNNVGISTHKRLQNVVHTIFDKGQPAISEVTR